MKNPKSVIWDDGSVLGEGEGGRDGFGGMLRLGIGLFRRLKRQKSCFFLYYKPCFASTRMQIDIPHVK